MNDRLAICLWDFSWYTRTGPGDCFADLDAACRETVERGFTTVRICAAPFLMFGTEIDTTALRLGPLPGGIGQGTRWYDLPGDVVVDMRAQLLALFRACQAHGLGVIVSSWEYQQSPSFALDPDWYEALYAVPPEERGVRLAEAEAALMEFLDSHGLADVVEFVEIHNEVATGRLAEALTGDLVVALKDRLTRAVDRFHELRPGTLCAVNYSRVPVDSMAGIPENIDVLVCHPYLYGVLQDLISALGLRQVPFDPAAVAASGLLRPGTPPYDPGMLTGWRAKAWIVCPGEMYTHDHIDAGAWDGWLRSYYPAQQEAMLEKLDTWIRVAADYAAEHEIPLVFGEGWIGYTPLRGRFEEDEPGATFIRLGIQKSAEVGAWGSIVCSNAAPHHPMWTTDVDLIKEANALFLKG